MLPRPKSFDSSSSETSRPALPLSPRSNDVAARFLALGRGPDFELREPGIVRQQPGQVVEHLHGAGKRILALQREIVVADDLIELLAQRVGRIRLHVGLLDELPQRHRMAAFLPKRHCDCDERQCQDQRGRRQDSPAAPPRDLRPLGCAQQIQAGNRE